MMAQPLKAHGSAAYRSALLASFPPGDAYPRNPPASGVRAGFIAAIGDGLSRAETEAFQLVLRELDPRTATYMFPEWLALTGIAPQATHAETVLAVMARLQKLGGQAVDYFIALAAALGVTIKIVEQSALRCGMRFGRAFGGIAWDFTWDVVTDQVNLKRMRFGAARCGEPFATWGNSLLELIIRRYHPAHTTVRFIYT